MKIQFKSKHKDITPYIHVTSPIRRLIDLLNQIIIFEEYDIVSKIDVLSLEKKRQLTIPLIKEIL